MAKVLLVSFLVFAGVLAASAQSACPEIISRGGWAARTGRVVPVLPIRPAPFVIVHPTQSMPCRSQGECSETIRNIQAFQLDGNGWPDISYHFLIGSDYRIYEGRGWGRLGENVGGFSNQAINIGFIGTFAQEPLTPRGLELLDEVIACGISIGALAQNVNVLAQCQVTNIVSCSATTVFDWVSEHPRFAANPTPV